VSLLRNAAEARRALERDLVVASIESMDPDDAQAMLGYVQRATDPATGRLDLSRLSDDEQRDLAALLERVESPTTPRTG
jgi:hypothetical protein